MRTDRSQPLVSVVTPSFNQGRFLAQTIESVASQDYGAIEHRIYDAGSTDSTPDVLARYKNRITAIVGPDSGQAGAINRGIRESEGEIVGWLNSDDYYFPGAIRSVVDYMQGHPDCVLVYGSASYVDEAGRRLGSYPTGEPDDLRYGCFICQPSVFLRRRALENVGLLDESLSYCMDYDLWLRLAEHFELHRIPNEIAAYRLHDDSKSIAGQLASRREVVEMLYRRLGSTPLTCLYGYADLAVRNRLRLAGMGRAFQAISSAVAVLATVALAAKYHPIPTVDDLSLVRRRLSGSGPLAPGTLPAAPPTRPPRP